MNKLTAELLQQLKSAAQEEIMCREASDTSDVWQDLASPENILLLIEIALPVLEQQQVMSVPAYYIVYHPNPDPNGYDDKEHSHCGSIHLARRLATEIGGTICPVYFGEQQQPTTDTYRKIENDEDRGDDEAFWDADYD